MTDPIVDLVCAELQERSRRGIAKYGTTLARDDMSLRQWLAAAMEEALDQALYLRRAIAELDSKNPQSDAPV